MMRRTNHFGVIAAAVITFLVIVTMTSLMLLAFKGIDVWLNIK